MTSKALALCLALLVCGCAASRPDHFYVLTTIPTGAPVQPAPEQTQVVLKVTLPSLVDRPEMVLATSPDGVAVLDHERWAAPLPDLVSQTLARDLERRRTDLLVGDRSFVGTPGKLVKINVEFVHLSIRKGGTARMEVHWRTSAAQPPINAIGSGTFEAPLAGDDYAAVARGLSACLALLADRLVQDIPPDS